MLSDYVKWGALAEVVVGGLVVGAGLPALFAVGVRALAGPGSHDDAGRLSRIRAAVAIACFAVVVGAVTLAIITIATSSPSPISTPSPIVTPDPGPLANAGPLTVPGEVTFGSTDFGGIPYNQAASVFAPNISPAVTESACGDAVSPMLFSGTPSTPPWGLFLMTDWNDPAVAPGAEKVQAFLLVVQSDNLPTAPTGPVGPRGLRLGTPTATIEAMFPAEAAVTTQRVTTILVGGSTETDVTERMFSIADVDGGPMIIGTVGANVSTIMWGNPAYVYVQRGTLRCAT